MRIDYLLLDASVGGGTVRTTFTMSQAMAARGHDTRVVSLLWSRPEATLTLPSGVPVKTLVPHPTRHRGRRARLRRLAGRGPAVNARPSRLVGELDGQAWRFTEETDAALREHLATTDAHVVVGTRTGLNLALAQLESRALRVAQEHVGLHHLAPAQREALGRHLPAVDAVVSLTQADARHYRSVLEPATTPVRVVPNAIDVAAPPPRTGRRAPVVVAAGRLARQKGFDLLVEAWQPVARAHPDWRLVIHGRGPLEQDLRNQVAAAGLEEQVLLPGFAPDLMAELRAASAFVLSSRFEGMPMVLLEAMACGTPVVAFDCPTGPRQMLQDERSGLLVPRGSVGDLSVAVERVVADPGLRRRLSRGGRRRVRRYSVERVAERWERLFKELAG